MSKHVLITGGAGFIGSHLADELVRGGYRVRVLDNLAPEVHGPGAERPAYLDRNVELIVGDVCDLRAVRRALSEVDAVYHFAALPGVVPGSRAGTGVRYSEANTVGTAVLLQALTERPVERLVVASSMSVYGEGLYRTPSGALQLVGERCAAQLEAKLWEPASERGELLVPLPTPETKPPSLSSVYALSKFDQERMSLMVGRAYDMPVVALRFFNVYGPRQPLSSPYTGVLATFAARLLKDSAPVIFEDGLQRRDFVSVYDAARAARLALESEPAAFEVINIGSGRACTVREIARRLGVVLGKQHVEPEVTFNHRLGDVRHCFPDLTQARKLLGYEPRVSLEEGLIELSAWLEDEIAQNSLLRGRAEHDARELHV